MNGLLNAIAGFSLPLVLSLLIVPLVIKLAHRVGALDQPGERKIHTHTVPRLGGVGVYASFFLSLLILYPSDPLLHSLARFGTMQSALLVSALLLVLAIGIWDDIRSLKPGQKFVAQVAAASMVYFAGVHISALTNLLGSNMLELGALDYPVTVLWIVGVTNAFNLIDGLDGLAAGVATIAAATICAISCLSHHYGVAMISLTLAGSLAGFLRYNFNPARIFLGDSGSLFLGFSLAILSTQSSTKGSTAFTILVPILALGLPIMDTLLSMLRRLLKSILPSESESTPLLRRLHLMVMPDKGHIHHQLIAKGFTHRSVVLLLYLVSCAFGAAAFTVQVSNSSVNSLLVFGIAVASLAGVQKLQYREMAILKNGLFLPLYDSPLMQQPFFHALLDTCFILTAYCVSSVLSGQGVLLTDGDFLLSAGAAGVLQLAAFYHCGLYRETIRFLGIGDLLNILKAGTTAIVLTAVLFMVLPLRAGTLSVTGLLLDFYILISLVAGTRVSFHILRYLSRRELEGGRRLLIYGAGTDGVLMLQKILNDHTPKLIPVGFLDDDPQLEGKFVNGFPVFGGHWKLEGLLHKEKIHELLIADPALKPEIIRRLERTALQHGIVMERSRIQVKEMRLSGTPKKVQSVLAYADR